MGPKERKMKEIKMWIKEMDREEKIDAVGSLLAWLGLFGSIFMATIICG